MFGGARRTQRCLQNAKVNFVFENEYCGYKVIYSNSARFRLHYYFLNLHLQYAVLSIIIYFTFTLTLCGRCARALPRGSSPAANALAYDLADIGSVLRTCTGSRAAMHFFFSFSAAIADRRPFSAAIGAAACRDRSDR